MALAVAMGSPSAESGSYDPLKVKDVKIDSQTFEVKDTKRNRILPIRVYFPESRKPAPVILFSHGLGGSRDNNPYLGNHWAKRGYAVVFVQHPGSDESVWKDLPQGKRLAAMKEAGSLDNFVKRGRDIPAVIDALTLWNGQEGHALFHRLDLNHIGMSGHSFGAITTQAIAGQSFVAKHVSFRDSRIKAAVMMSPQKPAAGDPAAGIRQRRYLACLLLTGTRDDGVILAPPGRPTAGLPLSPAGSLAWQVILDKANHMAFSERDLLGQPIKDPQYHRAILALTTAFWDAELRGDPAAKSWLQGDRARSVLTPQDLWDMNRKAKEQ